MRTAGELHYSSKRTCIFSCSACICTVYVHLLQLHEKALGRPYRRNWTKVKTDLYHVPSGQGSASTLQNARILLRNNSILPCIESSQSRTLSRECSHQQFSLLPSKPCSCHIEVQVHVASHLPSRLSGQLFRSRWPKNNSCLKERLLIWYLSLCPPNAGSWPLLLNNH